MPALRGTSVLAAIGWAVCMLALAMAVASAKAPEAFAENPPIVTVGMAADSLDPALRIAAARGYFAAEGLDVRLVVYDSDIKLMAPLATGQLAIASLPVSAQLLGQLSRTGSARIVADAGSVAPGFGYHALVVRKALAASGSVKALKDLKGMRVATPAPGSGGDVVLMAAIKQAGLKPTDISHLHMSSRLQLAALANGTLDAAMMTEPSATAAIAANAAVRLSDDARIVSSHQARVIVLSSQFATADTDTGRSFLKAYLRGARDYNDAFKDGRLDGPRADGVVSVLADAGVPKAMARTMVLPAVKPDGRPDVAALKADVLAHQAAGVLDGKVDIDKLVDLTLVDAAAKQLGPYRRR